MPPKIKYRATASSFFSTVSAELFNTIASFYSHEDFTRLHTVLNTNTRCKSHWGKNLYKYVHHAKPLFSIFENEEALRWVLKQGFDWHGSFELHLSALDPCAATYCFEREPIAERPVWERVESHINSLRTLCRTSKNLDLVRAIIENTHVNPAWVLCTAAAGGDVSVVKYLCEAGANPRSPNSRNSSSETPLYVATSYNCLSVVKFLVEEYYICDYGDEGEGCGSGSYNKGTGKGGIDEVNGEHSFTALSIASACGSLDMVRYLVDCGAAVNQNHNRHGLTPLHMAVTHATQKNREVVEFLCENGGDLHAQDSTPSRRSAVQIAGTVDDSGGSRVVVDYLDSLKTISM